MNLHPTNPQVTDADFDRVLNPAGDSILPSSGFADAVMTAIAREAAAPAPIQFPWKRAIPGFAAVVVVLAGLIAVLVSTVGRAFHSPAPNPAPFTQWQFHIASIFSKTAATGALWLLLSLAISGFCLLLCRRFVSAR
jgi:hypothetical protein